MKQLWPFAVASALFFAACDDKPAPAPEVASAKPAVATPKPTATASAAAPVAAAATSRNMVHCPNAVTGAETTITDTPDGIDITVTAKDEAGVKAIRERAKHAAEAAKAAPAEGAHTGEGKGGGALGRCPVVLRNTVVETADVEGGVKIHVKPTDAAETDWLRREAKDRQAELTKPGALEAGQRKMANCPSAVRDATTDVKEAGGKVLVTVTAMGEDLVKVIRERAKLIVEASKIDPTTVAHTGDGKGGGGFGRCPIVLENTTVEAKDVEDGSLFTVTPKDAAGLAALVKEAQDRAAKLATSGGEEAKK